MKKMIVVVAAGMTLSQVHALDRITLQNGKVIEGEVISYSGGVIKLKKSDGKISSGKMSIIKDIQFDVTEETNGVKLASISVTRQIPPPVEKPKIAIKTKPVKNEYSSLSSLIRKIPSGFDLSSDLWETNYPMARAKLSKWIKDNVVGSRLKDNKAKVHYIYGSDNLRVKSVQLVLAQQLGFGNDIYGSINCRFEQSQWDKDVAKITKLKVAPTQTMNYLKFDKYESSKMRFDGVIKSFSISPSFHNGKGNHRVSLVVEGTKLY